MIAFTVDAQFSDPDMWERVCSDLKRRVDNGERSDRVRNFERFSDPARGGQGTDSDDLIDGDRAVVEHELFPGGGRTPELWKVQLRLEGGRWKVCGLVPPRNGDAERGP